MIKRGEPRHAATSPHAATLCRKRQLPRRPSFNCIKLNCIDVMEPVSSRYRCTVQIHSTSGGHHGHDNGSRMLRYAGFWVTRRSGGVVCRHFDDLDAVLESDTSDDLRQLICPFQPPPGL